MRLAAASLFVSLAAIAGAWWWLGTPIAMPPSPLAAGEKLHCVSYAPFRGEQTPLVATTHIGRAQIEDDLARLATLTDCVRTYSVEHGLDQLPEIAARYGLKVMQGLWLSGNAAKDRAQIETTVALANRFPEVIRSVVVGNEVLLRGEMTAQNLAATIRSVKARVPMPVTYADVWEFWLRNPEIAAASDFVTIHILPYWEDFPIPAEDAARHVEAIHRRVAEAFPGKEILIGETGWPSAGRMREGALPAPATQARVIHDILGVAKQEKYRVNLIEAFDQPWKRELEGTVGGHWGFLDADTRAFKFGWGIPVSNHPLWRWQLAGGFVLAFAAFGAALGARRTVAPASWIGVGVAAVAGGVFAPWAIANVPLESLGAGGWARSIALAAFAIGMPIAVAGAFARDIAVPAFAQLLGGRADRPATGLARALGWLTMGLAVLATLVALGLVFDPRYRDFPFAPLTAAALPLLALSLRRPRERGGHEMSELAFCAVLVLSAGYILPNESLANWQSVWTCATLLAIALILFRARGARG